MSFDVVMARMVQLQTLFAPPAPSTPAPSTTTTAPATGTTAFASQLQSASATSLTPAAAPTNAGQAILNAIRPEVGQAEQPPGSNDSPRIAQYRQATAGSGVG